jgi:alpha-beta hydrolase superfamily lysophospholipase
MNSPVTIHERINRDDDVPDDHQEQHGPPSAIRQLSSFSYTFATFAPYMDSIKTKRLRYYLKWGLWVVLVQFVLINISASIYAYKFTHFYNGASQHYSSGNFFTKTWKLFVGPSFSKDTLEPEPPFSYSTVVLQTSDHIPIDAWYSEVAAPKGCVLFFHGYMINKSFLGNEAAMFREWGYNVLMVDLRGHGKSGGSSCTLGVKETDEVQKAFEFARAKGNKRIILYGVSLGAGICIKAASENKVQPDAIIADMPFGSLHSHFRSRAAVQGFPSEPFAALVTMWIGIERGYNGFNHDIAGYARKVSCPVLVEWGKKDSYVTRKELEGVYEQLASSNKKLVVYPDAGHESLLQVDPKAWKQEVSAFLSSLAKSGEQ